MTFFSRPIEFLDPHTDVIDVHSFRALERLKVHEARTAADLGSGVVRPSERERRRRLIKTSLNLRLVRGARKVA